MASNRVARGRLTQNLVRDWFRKHGWSGAESTPASLPGKDITGMPGYAPEVKATRGLRLTDALRQAERNAAPGEIPFVVQRPDGYGPEKIGKWLMVMDLEVGTKLLVDREFPLADWNAASLTDDVTPHEALRVLQEWVDNHE